MANYVFETPDEEKKIKLDLERMREARLFWKRLEEEELQNEANLNPKK